MQFHISIIGLATAALSAASIIDRRAACNADNCARLVTGTQAGLPSTRLADCSSFLAATVTPSPVHTTVTTTETSYEFSDHTYTTTASYVTSFVVEGTVSVDRESATQTNSLAQRNVAASAVPTYATSACPAASRYSSACSCAGATASTKTLSAETIVQTETITTTVSQVYNVTAATPVTTVVTVTAPATETGYPCGSTVPGNGLYTFRNYKVNCGQRAVGVTPSSSEFDGSESDCLRSCNGVKYCELANYQFSTGLCNLYYSTEKLTFVEDSDWDNLTGLY